MGAQTEDPCSLTKGRRPMFMTDGLSVAADLFCDRIKEKLHPRF